MASRNDQLRKLQEEQNAKEQQLIGSNDRGQQEEASLSDFGWRVVARKKLVHVGELAVPSAPATLPIHVANDEATRDAIRGLQWSPSLTLVGMGTVYNCDSTRFAGYKPGDGQKSCCSPDCACVSGSSADVCSCAAFCAEQLVNVECFHKKRCAKTVVRKNLIPATYIRKTGDRLSLFAAEHIRKGTFIGVYSGTVLTGVDATKHEYKIKLSPFDGFTGPATGDVYVTCGSGDGVRLSGSHIMFADSRPTPAESNAVMTNVHSCRTLFPCLFAQRDIGENEEILRFDPRAQLVQRQGDLFPFDRRTASLGEDAGNPSPQHKWIGGNSKMSIQQAPSDNRMQLYRNIWRLVKLGEYSLALEAIAVSQSVADKVTDRHQKVTRKLMGVWTPTDEDDAILMNQELEGDLGDSAMEWPPVESFVVMSRDERSLSRLAKLNALVLGSPTSHPPAAARAIPDPGTPLHLGVITTDTKGTVFQHLMMAVRKCDRSRIKSTVILVDGGGQTSSVVNDDAVVVVLKEDMCSPDMHSGLSGFKHASYYANKEILRQENLDVILCLESFHSTSFVGRLLTEFRPLLCGALVTHGQTNWTHMTTGSTAVDFFITDEMTSSYGANTEEYTESRVYLPGSHLCFGHGERLKHLRFSSTITTSQHKSRAIVLNCATEIPRCFQSAQYADEIWRQLGTPSSKMECYLAGFHLVNGSAISKVITDTCMVPPDVIVVTTRAHYGLPERVPVLPLLSSHTFLTERHIASHVEVMRAVPDSVLWIRPLLPASVMRRLHELCAQQEILIDERIVIAHGHGFSIEEDVRKMQLVTAALDTSPRNDAEQLGALLYAGIPTITVSTTTLCNGRLGASLVEGSLRIPALLADSAEQAKEKLIHLIRHTASRDKLSHLIRERVESSASFHPTLYAPLLENAILEIGNKSGELEGVPQWRGNALHLITNDQVYNNEAMETTQSSSSQHQSSSITLSSSSSSSSASSSFKTAAPNFSHASAFAAYMRVGNSADDADDSSDGGQFLRVDLLGNFCQVLHVSSVSRQLLHSMHQSITGDSVGFPVGALILDYFAHNFMEMLRDDPLPLVSTQAQLLEYLTTHPVARLSNDEFQYLVSGILSTVPDDSESSGGNDDDDSDDAKTCPICKQRMSADEFTTTHYRDHAKRPKARRLMRPGDCGEERRISGGGSQRFEHVDSSSMTISRSGTWEEKIAKYKSTVPAEERTFFDGQHIVSFHWLLSTVITVTDALRSRQRGIVLTDGSVATVFLDLLKYRAMTASLPRLRRRLPSSLQLFSVGIAFVDSDQVRMYCQDILQEHSSTAELPKCTSSKYYCALCMKEVDDEGSLAEHDSVHHVHSASAVIRCDKCTLPLNSSSLCSERLLHQLLHQ